MSYFEPSARKIAKSIGLDSASMTKLIGGKSPTSSIHILNWFHLLPDPL